MNIFVLDDDPKKIPLMMCDQHVVKMILESAQMLSTVHRIYKNTDVPCKSTHIKHPCTIWVSKNYKHYMWLKDHWIALMEEYNYRYNKIHIYNQHIKKLQNPPTYIPDINFNTFALAMPKEFQNPKDPILSYRKFYANKKFVLRYTKREPPEFLKELNCKCRIKIKI